MSPDNLKRARVVVRGRVQGVCFRYYTVETAQKYQITGWVRNGYSGEVEVLLQGRPVDVDRMVDWLKTGPSMAHVTGISVRYEPPRQGEFSRFTITY